MPCKGKKTIHTAKWGRAVKHIKAAGGEYDPYAVATATLGKKSFKKSALKKKGKKK